MITATIEKSRIKASGHAGTAPKGQDLVCAAFTMLCHSLIESFRKLTADSFIYKIDSGSFILSAHCRVGKETYKLEKLIYRLHFLLIFDKIIDCKNFNRHLPNERRKSC